MHWWLSQHRRSMKLFSAVFFIFISTLVGSHCYSVSKEVWCDDLVSYNDFQTMLQLRPFG